MCAALNSSRNLAEIFRAHGRAIWVAALLFTLGICLGGLTPVTQVSGDPVLSSLFRELEQLAQHYRPYSLFTIGFLFLKNTLTIVLCLVFGFMLGVPPALTLVLNGWFIGFFSKILVQRESLMFAAGGILPHGLFEIPALIFGGASGLRFGIATLRKILSALRGGDYSIRPVLRQSLILTALAVCLLIPAAIAETYITPVVLSLLKSQR